MKDFFKRYWFFIILFVLIIGAVNIGIGVHAKQRLAEESNLSKFVKDNKNIIIADLKESDPNKRIKSVQVDYEKVEKNPMGGVNVYGYVNNDKTLQWSTVIVKFDTKVESTGVDASAELSSFLSK